MSNVKFELNSAGVRKLLQSGEAMSICQGYAGAIQGRCGEGYEVTTFTGRTRVNASVHATTFKARKENAENNTLLKAVRG